MLKPSRHYKFECFIIVKFIGTKDVNATEDKVFKVVGRCVLKFQNIADKYFGEGNLR